MVYTLYEMEKTVLYCVISAAFQDCHAVWYVWYNVLSRLCDEDSLTVDLRLKKISSFSFAYVTNRCDVLKHKHDTKGARGNFYSLCWHVWSLLLTRLCLFLEFGALSLVDFTLKLKTFTLTKLWPWWHKRQLPVTWTHHNVCSKNFQSVISLAKTSPVLIQCQRTDRLTCNIHRKRCDWWNWTCPFWFSPSNIQPAWSCYLPAWAPPHPCSRRFPDSRSSCSLY